MKLQGYLEADETKTAKKIAAQVAAEFMANPMGYTKEMQRPTKKGRMQRPYRR